MAEEARWRTTGSTAHQLQLQLPWLVLVLVLVSSGRGV
jgi:hypothetical protein